MTEDAFINRRTYRRLCTALAAIESTIGCIKKAQASVDDSRVVAATVLRNLEAAMVSIRAEENDDEGGDGSGDSSFLVLHDAYSRIDAALRTN